VAKSSTLVQDVALVTQLVHKANIAKLSADLIRSTGSLKRQERAQRMRTENLLTDRVTKKLIKQPPLLELPQNSDDIRGDLDQLPSLPKQRRRSSKVVDFFMRRKQTAKVAPTLSVPGEEQTAAAAAAAAVTTVLRRDSFGMGVYSVATSIRPLAEGPDSTTREAIVDVCMAAGVPQENIDMVFTVAEFNPDNVDWRSFVAVLSASFVPGGGIDAYRVASSIFVEAMCEATNVSSIAHTEVSLALLELASLDPTLDDKDVLAMCTELEAAARQGGGLVSPTGLFKPTAARKRLKRKNDEEEREELKRRFESGKYTAKKKPKLGGVGSYGGLGDVGDKSVWSLAPDIDLSYLGRIKAKLDTGMKRPRHRKTQSQFKIAPDLNLDGLRNQNHRVDTRSAHKRSEGKKIQINHKTKKYNSVKSTLGNVTKSPGTMKKAVAKVRASLMFMNHPAPGVVPESGTAAVPIPERLAPRIQLSLSSSNVMPPNFQKRASVTGITPTILPTIRASFSAAPPSDLDPLAVPRNQNARIDTRSAHKRSEGKKIQINHKMKKYHTVKSTLNTGNTAASSATAAATPKAPPPLLPPLPAETLSLPLPKQEIQDVPPAKQRIFACTIA
jgi:hypothetical protein